MNSKISIFKSAFLAAFFVLFALCNFSFAAEGIEPSTKDEVKHHTKLGEVTYSYPFKIISLNGKPLTQVQDVILNYIVSGPGAGNYLREKNQSGNINNSSFSFYEEDFQLESKHSELKGFTQRILIAEISDCPRSFFIIDFSGNQPFISEKFGYNPEGKACLKFKRAKWGKRESYIYLEGPMKYVYYTNGRVIGPID